MNVCRQKRQAMKGRSEKHAPPTKDNDRKQHASSEVSSQAHAPRLEDAFFAVIYTPRAPGKASPLCPSTPFPLLLVSE